MSSDYKAAYLRQKKARALAEQALEEKSRELYENHQSLMQAYNRLKDQKAQILHQEKLASIGELSAGVAHEINNPAGFVKSNLSSLRKYAKSLSSCVKASQAFIDVGDFSDAAVDRLRDCISNPDIEFMMADVDELIEDSQSGVQKIQEIVASLKDFARPAAHIDEEIEINECIKATLKLIGAALKCKAEVKLDLGDVSVVAGRRGELSQVLLNLLTNAIQAIPEKGTIEISTRQNGSFVDISVKDDGVGIPESSKFKIFDPFYSTKTVGEGTGLGLSISHGIVKKQGGIITVSSEEGEGTTFLISLPSMNASP